MVGQRHFKKVTVPIITIIKMTFFRLKISGVVIGVILHCLSSYADEKTPTPVLRKVKVGMELKVFFKRYPKAKARTYRKEKTEEWLTFDYQKEHLLTFYLKDNKVADWKLDDRQEVIREYLSEFCSQSFIQSYPKIYKAIQSALEKIPYEIFLSLTDRARPVLFTEYHTIGVGRFANSSEIMVFKDDAPSFTKGLTIIKLSTELEETDSAEDIEGVILHELAHRVLEHSQKEIRTCQREKEANQLVKTWGLEEEFLKAKARFGSKDKLSDQCQ